MKPHVALLSTGLAQTVVLAVGPGGKRIAYWEDPTREDAVCVHGETCCAEVARELGSAFGLPVVEASMPRRVFAGDILAWYEENLPAFAPELV